MTLVKRFLEWIRLKEKLHTSHAKPPLFKEGEVWWCSIGENIGIEVDGKSKKFSRPVVVFKKLSAEGFLAIPLSTKIKIGTWYVPMSHRNIKCVAVLSQARVLSVKRILEKYGEVNEEEMQKIRSGFCNLYLGEKFVPPFQAGSWDNPKYASSIAK